MLTIHAPTPDTPAKVRRASEDPGRPANRLRGGWLDDLTSLKKFVSMCPLCVGKFNPQRYGYELWRSIYTIATCDLCKVFDTRCKSYIPQSHHDQIGDARRRGRWASRARL